MSSYTLSDRQLCDLELLMDGSFAPLTGYLSQTDYQSVLDNMTLSTGELWPMPITFSVPSNDVPNLSKEKFLTLRDKNLTPIAKLHITDIYEPNLHEECEKVFGTTDTNHPYVNILLSNPDVHYVGGTVEQLTPVPHYDFQDIRNTPEQIKTLKATHGWDKMLGFQTRNPMHNCHYELSRYALSKAQTDAKTNNVGLLLQPIVGVTQDCDINYHTRVKCYRHILTRYPDQSKVTLSLLPLSMRMGGPREALWHALIRQNYGCDYFVVGRDHAGPSSKTKDGNAFYGPYDAHDLLSKVEDRLAIHIVKSVLIVHVNETNAYMPIDEVPQSLTTSNLSGTELRRRLRNNEPIPEWFTMPEIAKELQLSEKRTGVCYYLVGLSGAGKSTIANALREKLLETHQNSNITILDGDVIRTNLSKGLGFSKKDRSTNVRRIGYVAATIVKHGGICICSNIAPYEDDRQYNRQLISQHGKYVEVYVNTSLEVCEERDVKGLYKKVRAGIIPVFTGISDPFEVPENPTVTVTGAGDMNQNVEAILSV